MANGNMGVLVWGEDCRLCLTINRSDLWDHRYGECVEPGTDYQQMVRTFDPMDVSPTQALFVKRKMACDNYDTWWPSTRLPVGRFELTMRSSLQRVALDYQSGTVTVATEDGLSMKLAMSQQTCQLLIDDPDQLITDRLSVPAWEYVGTQLAHVGFQSPIIYNTDRNTGWFQACPEDPGVTALCMQHARGLCISLQLCSEPAWSVVPEDWQRTVQANTSRWERYWSQCPRIALPHEPELARFYQFALYKFACATDPSGVACGLQGPWVEEYQKTPWSGDYHFNINIQQIYTLALSIGAYEHMLPLFDMLESKPFMKVMHDNARNLLGIDDGLLLTHAVDDRGMQCGGISVGSALDFACGGWMAQLYWQYYQYTQNTTFLRERALPFMRGVMHVYEAVITEHEGRLSIPLSISAEYGFIFSVKINGKMCRQIAGRDPSNQLMCVHMLIDALVEACSVLDQAPEPAWMDIKQRLPKYTTDNSTGTERIVLWEGQDLDVCHRHHSHLASVYPFMNYNPDDPDEVQILNNTIDHWIFRGMGQWSEWCYPWAAIIHARMGFSESPLQLLKLWRELFLNEGMATVYLPRFHGLTVHRRADMDKPRQKTEVMQLDGTMAGATAILEMLVHEQQDVIHLFRGIPEVWQQVSFENVRLSGGYRISATIFNGKLSFTSIKGPNSVSKTVIFRGQKIKVSAVEDMKRAVTQCGEPTLA